MTEIVISSIAVGRWVQQASLFRAVARKSRALPQKLPHNLTRTGDYGRYQLEGVEHQGEVLMINPTQVFVACEKESAAQQSRFGQNEGIVNFLPGQQASRPELPRHSSTKAGG